MRGRRSGGRIRRWRQRRGRAGRGFSGEILRRGQPFFAMVTKGILRFGEHPAGQACHSKLPARKRRMVDDLPEGRGAGAAGLVDGGHEECS